MHQQKKMFKFIRTCLSVLVVILSMSGSVRSQDDSTHAKENEAVATTPDTVSVSDVVPDTSIETRLTQICESTDWFTDLEIESSHGVVTMRGNAESDEYSQWAKEIATRTEGVVGVKNEFVVASKIDFANSLTVVRSSLEKLWRQFLAQLPLIVAGILVLVATWIVSRIVLMIVSRILRRSDKRLRRSLRDLLRQLSSITVWLAGLMLATVVVFPGMTPAKALAVLGLGSVAIGFAFKDIFENFFAGVLILWRYPFDIGDFIEFDGIVGKVEEITIRNTMVRRTDGELVVIPNAQIFKSNVEVLTSQDERRIRIDCGIAYGEDATKAKEVIKNAVTDCETVSTSQEVQVFANAFADSSINFEVAWWAGANPLDIRRSRDEVIRSIKEALDNAEIEIPFPYRTLTFNEPLRVEGATS